MEVTPSGMTTAPVHEAPSLTTPLVTVKQVVAPAGLAANPDRAKARLVTMLVTTMEDRRTTYSYTKRFDAEITEAKSHGL
jgi:hypothetical protein